MILRATAEFWSSAAVGVGALVETPTRTMTKSGATSTIARPTIRIFPSFCAEAGSGNVATASEHRSGKASFAS